MESFFNALKSSLILSVIVILTGCVNSRVNIVSPLSPEKEANPANGVVVARVINAGDTLLPFNQFTITPDNFNESKQVKMQRLTSMRPELNGTTIFASELVPGTYALSSIRSYYTFGNYWYSRFLDADAKFGTFKVEAGKVTDLGTIVFYPKPQEDRYIEMLLRLPEQVDGTLLQQYFPFYEFDSENVITWDDDERDEERFSLYASIAQNPVSFTERYLAETGNLYFLSKLGVFIKRTPDGSWETDAVDTNLELSAIAEMPNGDLFVGSSNGRLFRKRAGYDWEDISLTHDTDIHYLIPRVDNTLDMVVTNDDRLMIMRTVANQINLDWQTMNQYSFTTFWAKADIEKDGSSSKVKKKKRYIVRVRLDDYAGQPLIKILTQSQNRSPIYAGSDYAVYRYNPDTWVVSSFETANDISFTVDAGAVKLGVEEAGFWSLTGKPTYHRQTENGGWEKINLRVRKCGDELVTVAKCQDGSRIKSTTFNLGSVPWFISPTEALVVANFSNTDFWTGERTNKTKILKTTDGGKSWLDTGGELPKEYCREIITEITDRLLLSCNGATGDFYESFDFGKTWNLTRQHQNF